MPAINFILLIDVLGTAAFAISGAAMAIQKKLDLFGVIIIAFVTAIGGGTIRDVLLGQLPVAWLANELIITVILFSAIATIAFQQALTRIGTTLFLFDSLGLGLFTAVGMQKAMLLGLSPGVTIAIGTISACFGGVLRDVLLNQVPLIFRKEIYASACIAGGLFYFALLWLGVSHRIAQGCSFLFIFILRIIVVRYQLSLPNFNKTPSS